MRLALVSALSVALLAALTPPSSALEVGGGRADGSASCSGGHATAAFSSTGFVYAGVSRSVSVALDGLCWSTGQADDYYGGGTATLSGDGLSCGTDPDRPFSAGYFVTTLGRRGSFGFGGRCIVDGVERDFGIGIEVVLDHGSAVGLMRPSDGQPV